MISKPVDKSSGIAMLEALITIVVLSVGLVALLAIQTYLENSGGISGQQIRAVNLAENQLESLRAYRYLTTAQGTPSYEAIANGSSTQTVNGTSYTVTWTSAAPTGSNSTLAYKIITVTVTWQGGDNRPHSVSLSSIISQFDPATSAKLVAG